jgi:hypothetical protein
MRRTQEGESKAAHLAYSIAASTDLFDKSGPAVYYQNVFLNNAGSAEESASGFSSAGLPQHPSSDSLNTSQLSRELGQDGRPEDC